MSKGKAQSGIDGMILGSKVRRLHRLKLYRLEYISGRAIEDTDRSWTVARSQLFVGLDISRFGDIIREVEFEEDIVGSVLYCKKKEFYFELRTSTAHAKSYNIVFLSYKKPSRSPHLCHLIGFACCPSDD